ncbi:MAG: hypothetical protein ACJ8FT_01795 [Sphingomonas sp.]
MKRLMIILAAGAAGGLSAAPAPAFAQGAPTTSEITVYGTDPCPRSTDSAVYVCNRRPETERYRLPKNQQLQGTRQQRESWANKAQTLSTVGNTGTGSCSAVGPGGFTGCLTQQINENRKANREQQQDNTPPPQ